MKIIQIFLAVATLVSGNTSAQTPYEFRVPTDTKATYYGLELTGDYPMRTIVTKRVGPSGITFSKRLYDCKAWKVKYLGTGDSLEAMKNSAPDPKMAPIVSQSIADFVGQIACRWKVAPSFGG